MNKTYLFVLIILLAAVQIYVARQSAQADKLLHRRLDHIERFLGGVTEQVESQATDHDELETALHDHQHGGTP